MQCSQLRVQSPPLKIIITSTPCANKLNKQEVVCVASECQLGVLSPGTHILIDCRCSYQSWRVMV